MKIKDVIDNVKHKSITSKLSIYFIGFAICIFIMLWCMQVVFLQNFYSNMKKREIVRLCNEVEDMYYDYKEQTTESSIDRLSFKNNANILIMNLDGTIKYSSNSRNFFQDMRMGEYSIIPTEKILNEIKENKVSRYTIKLERMKSDMFIYAKLLNNNKECLIVSTSIDPIDATANVLRYQLLYIIIISLLISAVISIFLSKRIAKPIVDINENAKKLANGNYNIEFKGAGYKEIDDLSDTLNFATKQLEKTDNIRKELIANVSHDLKTPLTMIKAYSEMIKDLYINNQVKTNENLDIIISETDRLTNLVNDMMDLSKLEANNVLIQKEEFDLVESTKNIIDSFIALPQNSDFNITIESPKTIIILADKIKIEQVIYNLISNAINYSEGNKNILVKIEEKHNEIKYSVIDNGKGIDENDLQYIWNRYYRADKSYERSTNGTGLGLSIVKNVLELHNAKYGVKSKLGEGSTFWFEMSKK